MGSNKVQDGTEYNGHGLGKLWVAVGIRGC